MIRRTFLQRMMGAVVGVGLLGSELLSRREGILPEGEVTQYAEGIRNVIQIEYDGGNLLTAQDHQSVAAYGRRKLVVEDSSSLPSTREEAKKMAYALLREMAYPPASARNPWKKG